MNTKVIAIIIAIIILVAGVYALSAYGNEIEFPFTSDEIDGTGQIHIIAVTTTGERIDLTAAPPFTVFLGALTIDHMEAYLCARAVDTTSGQFPNVRLISNLNIPVSMTFTLTDDSDPTITDTVTHQYLFDEIYPTDDTVRCFTSALTYDIDQVSHSQGFSDAVTLTIEMTGNMRYYAIRSDGSELPEVIQEIDIAPSVWSFDVSENVIDLIWGWGGGPQ